MELVPVREGVSRQMLAVSHSTRHGTGACHGTGYRMLILDQQADTDRDRDRDRRGTPEEPTNMGYKTEPDADGRDAAMHPWE